MNNIEKLLVSLSYCNKYIKVNKTKNYKDIISNTKFYTLKQCIIDYLISNAESLNLIIGDCVIQTHENEEDVILIPITFDNNTYEFHQLYNNIKTTLIENNINIVKGNIFESCRDVNFNDDKIFKDSIAFIKDYVWSHYKKTLQNYFINKPVQYINLVKLCSSKKPGNVDILYDCNGSLLNNNTKVKLVFKNEKVICKELYKVRKNIKTYISQREQYYKN
jgi:hypothetical protein